MSRLDDELREAVAASDDDDTATTPEAGVPVSREVGPQQVAGAMADPDGSRNGRNLGLLFGLLAAGGTALWLVLGSSTEALQHDTTVEKVLEAGKGAEGKILKVEGQLVHGTLMKRDEPCEYRFNLRSKDPNHEGNISVRYPACIVPDNFRDVAGMDVIVAARGKLEDGVLVADQISTKCPTKYEMQQQQQLGVETPHEKGADILSFDNEG